MMGGPLSRVDSRGTPHAGRVRDVCRVMNRPFEQIVTEHGATVLRVCRAVLGPTDAEDAWSETFLAALRAWPELAEDANVEAWLVTIAHRKAIDVARAAGRRAVPVETVPDGTSSLGTPEDHDHDLYAALSALSTRQREVVAYHYLAGLPYAEVAAITGGSTDAARRAAADGIRILRTTYAPATAARRGSATANPRGGGERP